MLVFFGFFFFGVLAGFHVIAEFFFGFLMSRSDAMFALYAIDVPLFFALVVFEFALRDAFDMGARFNFNPMLHPGRVRLLASFGP